MFFFKFIGKIKICKITLNDFCTKYFYTTFKKDHVYDATSIVKENPFQNVKFYDVQDTLIR